MASEASELENKLVAFVEGHHPETFSAQDVVNLRRNVIIHFFQISGPPRNDNPHVLYVVKLIMENIQSKVKLIINMPQDVDDTLKLFKLCMVCQSIIAGRGNIQMIEPPVSPDYRDTFHSLVKRIINEYHAKVLKLWADVLVKTHKITQPAIDEMKLRVSAKDGYEQKMRELYGNPSGTVWGPRGHIKNNLDESVLLDFLTLFHVATPVQITARYDNIGPLDSIVLSIISQFMLIDNRGGFSIIHAARPESEINMLHLTCVVVLTQTQTPSPPVLAYLSSDVLDQCVKKVRRFPTTDEFIMYMKNRMIEKVAAFTQPQSHPPPSAPSLDSLGGGKKTRRRMSKKHKHFKKSRHNR
jgi:hypothetical protein